MLQQIVRAIFRFVRRGMMALVTLGVLLLMAFHVAEGLIDRSHPYPLGLLERFGESRRVESDDGDWVRVLPAPSGEHCIRVSLDDVSPHLVHALIASEDRRFRSHAGVDPVAIVRAAVSSWQQGRIVSGASTLTMQLARILEPRPRCLCSKMREAIRARQIERVLTKYEILEAYLNFVPWGGVLRGAEAASMYWFGKSARDLAPDEAAMLVAMLPAPSRRVPDRAADVLRTYRDRILRQMAAMGTLGGAALLQATQEPIRARRHPWRRPRLATREI